MNPPTASRGAPWLDFCKMENFDERREEAIIGLYIER
jgi:hypothetical protein